MCPAPWLKDGGKAHVLAQIGEPRGQHVAGPLAAEVDEAEIARSVADRDAEKCGQALQENAPDRICPSESRQWQVRRGSARAAG